MHDMSDMFHFNFTSYRHTYVIIGDTIRKEKILRKKKR